MKPFAEVIVDVTAKKLDRVFHYSIPQALRGKLSEGMRVIVPFGPRKVAGYIINFSDSAEVAKTRDIISVMDESPILNKDLLLLADWIADQYMCSKVDVIRSMMPPKARAGFKFVTSGDSTDLFHEEKVNLLNDEENEVYKYILEQSIISYEDLRLRFGAKTGSLLKKLAGLGLARMSNDVKADQGPLLVQTVELSIPNENVELVIAGFKRSPKRGAVIITSKEKGPLTINELARLAGTTASTVRDMIKKGYLKASLSEVRRDPYSSRSFPVSGPLKLTDKQDAVLGEIIKALNGSEYETFLLHGVTGSGKTEVYLQAIDYCLKQGRQAIVLVPEISLTPQMVERFKGRFGDQVAVLHSRLSAGERYDEWRMIRSGQVKVVVGARSAVFAPFKEVGLIIIDEEHENSYKQEDNPKYHARDVAVARAKICGGIVVLGSATPSLESYTRAVAGKYSLLTLPDRINSKPMPEVALVDLREEIKAGNRSIFSRELIDKLSWVLERKEQAILFLNRRGYATFVNCRECGLVMKCPKCSITLTYHAWEGVLRCHYCDFQQNSPTVCPKCGSKSIRHFGAGTQKVEQEVNKLFPEARVVRMDMDTTTGKGSHERILNEFKEGKADILIGTQMIAKGLDFSGVTLVGVVTADTALNLPDFRSSEKTFQLLTQVAGRAGRGAVPGEVIVQTYSPEHYSIVNARTHNYEGFYQEEMRIRDALGYPPYCSLARILIYGTEENSVIRGAELLAGELNSITNTFDLGVEQPILGPAPAPLSKLRNRYRWQICVKGKSGQLVRQVIRELFKNTETNPAIKTLGVSVDIDPVTLI